MRVAVTLESTKNARKALLTLTVARSAPGPTMTSSPAVSDSSRALLSVIVCGVAKTVGSNPICRRTDQVRVGEADHIDQISGVSRPRAVGRW